MSQKRSWAEMNSLAQTKTDAHWASVCTCLTSPARLRRQWPPIAASALDARQVDAVEQHLQIDGANFHASSVGTGKPKRAGFESLVDDDKTVFVPVQQLDTVGTLVA